MRTPRLRLLSALLAVAMFFTLLPVSALAEDNRLAVRSLAELEAKLEARKLHPMFLTGHTGWTDNFTFAFAHKDKLCSPFKKRVHDPSAPYDAYDESDDTEERSKSGYLKGVGR